MKLSRLLLIALLVSAYPTVSVINIQLAKPKDVAEVTLDMMDVMSRAFDESEGGESSGNACWGFKAWCDWCADDDGNLGVGKYLKDCGVSEADKDAILDLCASMVYGYPLDDHRRPSTGCWYCCFQCSTSTYCHDWQGGGPA